jgi:hypothetical protein
MARISSYPKDTTIQDQDAWIGTAFPNRQTKNFLAIDVARYLNTKGKISVSAQMTYKFEADASEAASGMFYGVADGTAFSAITSLNVHSVDAGGQNVVDFVNYLVDSDILISEQNNIGEFGHYKITAYTDNGDGFYTLELSYIGGDGVLVDQAYYDIANFVISSADQADKHYTFNQATPANPWSVTHNLNKYPSVTVALPSGQVGQADVTYIDENNLTITFTGDESGKAYMN